MQAPHPTAHTYTNLTQIYDHFKVKLFGGTLPPCLITMQRQQGTYGYFSGDRWASSKDPEALTDEIALNPEHFASRPLHAVLSTLAHEMVHLWQHHHGKPSRSAYHNKEWAQKMRAIGLIPTDTGRPGGKEVGQKMTHYIEQGGLFERVCKEITDQGVDIPYFERTGINAKIKKKKAASKTKFTCPSCQEVNVWGKPDIRVRCDACDELMIAEGGGEDEEDS